MDKVIVYFVTLISIIGVVMSLFKLISWYVSRSAHKKAELLVLATLNRELAEEVRNKHTFFNLYKAFLLSEKVFLLNDCILTNIAL